MSTAHVLVVDDEADIRALIQEILTDESYEVTVAGDAAEARAARDEVKPDLILLDIWMPDTDGISLLREWSEQDSLDCPKGLPLRLGQNRTNSYRKYTRSIGHPTKCSNSRWRGIHSNIRCRLCGKM